jgi:hypothetical protein
MTRITQKEAVTMKTTHCKNDVDSGCGRLCSHDDMTHLMTRLALIEGSILERLEKEKVIALRELMEVLEWEPCGISMAVGSLVRQGIIQCTEFGKNVFVECCEPVKK